MQELADTYAWSWIKHWGSRNQQSRVEIDNLQ